MVICSGDQENRIWSLTPGITILANPFLHIYPLLVGKCSDVFMACGVLLVDLQRLLGKSSSHPFGHQSPPSLKEPSMAFSTYLAGVGVSWD